MTRTPATVALGLIALALAAPARAQDAALDEPQARIWFDRGEEPVVERGDRLRLYYRASRDAYVAVIHIDTDGTANLVFPRSPEENHYVRGGRDYRLLFPRSPYWYVEDAEGVGYFFLVASPEPFDFTDFPYSYYDGNWDLSRVGRRVYRDPYVAMDDYVASLVPDWEVVPYALDFASYHVGARHDYPRFLCYDCHGFRPYAAWNPYYATCTSFQVVVWDDPYYYPARRYRGRDVVWVRPPYPGQPRFSFKERPEGARDAVVVQARPAVTADDVRSGVRRRGGAVEGAPPVTGRPADDAEGRPLVRWRDPAAAEGADRPGSALPPRTGEPLAPRRPSDAIRTPGASSGRAPVVAPPSRGGEGEARRPVLRRRPSGGEGARPADPGGSRPDVRRPPGGSDAGVRPAAPDRRPSGSGPAARPSLPDRRPGGGDPAARPSVPVRRPPGGDPVPRPSTPVSRPTGGEPAARPAAPARRPSGGAVTSGPDGSARRPAAGAPSRGGAAPARRPGGAGSAVVSIVAPRDERTRAPSPVVDRESDAGRAPGVVQAAPTGRDRPSVGTAPSVRSARGDASASARPTDGRGERAGGGDVSRAAGPSGAGEGAVTVRRPVRDTGRPTGVLGRSGVRPSGGAAARPTARSDGSAASGATARSGGAAGSRPSVRSGGSSDARPTLRSGGASGARPAVRPQGRSGPGPAVRPGGSAGVRPSARPRGSSGNRRPPRPAGGSAALPAARSGGSSARPPVRVRPRGGSDARPAAGPAVRRPGRARPGGS